MVSELPQEAVEAAADAWVAYYDKVIETEGRVGDSARAAHAALAAAAPILREQWEAEQDEWSNDLAELLDGFIEDSDDAQESLIEQAIRRLTADLAVARQQLDAVRAEVVEIWRHFQGIANYPPLIRDGGDGLRWAKLGRARCDALLAVAPTGDAPTTKDGGDLDCRHGCNGDCITSGSDDCNFTCHDTKDVSR